MTSQTKTLLAIAVGLVVLAASVPLLWNKLSSPAPATVETPVAPADGKADAPPRELNFKDTLLIENNRISVDRGPYEQVPCSQSGTRFGWIKVAPDLIGQLVCVDDYMGGISLIIETGGAEPVVEKLGMAFADAGELSDTRSWIQRSEKTSSINTKRATINSAEEDDEVGDGPNAGMAQCERKAELLSFDPKEKTFTASQLDFDPVEFEFKSPYAVNESCLGR